jgi:hypothetical protein
MTQIQIELALLHAELQNVAPHVGIKDGINWDRHAAGKFTTASAYKFITNTPHIRVSTGRLWKIGAFLRVAVFIWFRERRAWYMTATQQRNRLQIHTNRNIANRNIADTYRDLLINEICGHDPHLFLKKKKVIYLSKKNRHGMQHNMG